MFLSKCIAFGTMALFMTLLVLATFFAYTRGYSGTTGLDMAKVQKMRTNLSTSAK